MAAIRTQSVPALERGLSILECLAEAQNGLTLSQITRTLHVPKSSVHCLLVTFERCGYIQRDENGGRYRLGLRLLGLANVALPAVAMCEDASAALRDLMGRTHLTVHMATLDRDEMVLVARMKPPGVMAPATWIGKRMELHCTALGKAFLAYVEPDESERLIRKRGLLRHNENTIGSVRRMKEELERVRQCGYSLDDEEEEIGVRCVGAPVLDRDGRPRAAISIVGTTSEIDDGNVRQFGALVREAAAAIAERLGRTENSASQHYEQSA
jgi:DNA-binding IclR family transcriptional regulator